MAPAPSTSGPAAKGKDAKNLRIRIGKIEEKIRLVKSKKRLKVELKNVSLGTSKINYIDPRITISFLKKNKLDIDTVLNLSLQDKFSWALNVDENFKF